MPDTAALPAARFRDRVMSVWRELEAADADSIFDNNEGGSVEQQRDRRLQLHHCANYAAVLTLLDGVGPDLRLLELGCGSGVLSHALARLMPAGWRLTATDYSESLLRSARDRFCHANLKFEHLDVRELGPGRLNETDVVFMLEVIEHLPQPEAADLLHRLHRTMRPGARLLITTLDRSPFSRPFSAYAPHFVEYTYRLLNDFLGNDRNSPFESFRILRIISPRIAGESVRNENRGGYIMNRVQRWALGVGKRHPAADRWRERASAFAFRLYTRLPRRDDFDIEAYLATIDLVGDDRESHDHNSFSLLAELRKA